MAVVVISEQLTQENLKSAREEYDRYIKITADLKKRIVAIGGEYHADAEQILTKKFDSKRSDIWGGGYNINTKQFETNALINIRQPNNPNMEIIDPEARKRFLELAQEKLMNIQELL